MRKIIAIGSIALDDVETPYGERKGAVGGSLTYFSYAASIFSEVALVGVVGKDFPQEILAELKEKGCCLEGVEVKEGRSFRWAGVYRKGMEDPETLKTELGLFQEFDPYPPESYKETEILYLGNLSPSLQKSLLSRINYKIVAMDTMNHWIQNNREELLEILPEIDILFINRQEAEMLSGETGSFPSCLKLLEYGPKTVVVKRGEGGAIMCREKDVAAIPAYPVSKVIDPTGAGDSFAGGFLGALSSGRNYRQALAVGVAVSSFSVESFSIDRLRGITLKDVEARLQKIRELVSF
ncbi:MAG: sugar kinase [Candidatus Aminicenantes bacterium]|nr:sugar kinase [Candidatus Aminicenantes bacterium]